MRERRAVRARACLENFMVRLVCFVDTLIHLTDLLQ